MQWGSINLFVSLSACVLALGFLLFFYDAIRSARKGPPAGDNPWDAGTLEWATTSPPPDYNFAYIPVVTSAYPLWDEREALPVATGLRLDRREIVVSTVGDARPEARESSPRNSIWPFWTAIATSIMLIASVFSPWAVIWGSVPIAVALIGWFWPKGVPEDDA
jgi:cytochrome c oxidase subunit 1